MCIYWVVLLVFHVMVLIHTGNSCTLHIESDEDFVLFGQTANLNCTSDCKHLNWETRLAKPFTDSKEFFTTVTVEVSDWEESPITCLAELNGKLYKTKIRVEPYVLPSRVDIDLNEKLEEDKEHELTCSVYDVAPVKHVLLSVTRGGEPFLYRTYMEDTRREPQNLKETFKFTANRSNNLQDFACQVTLNLTRVTNTTVQSSPVTVRTYALPENPIIEVEDWVEQGTVPNISCNVLHAFPPENITTVLSADSSRDTFQGDVFVSTSLDKFELPLGQNNIICSSQVSTLTKKSNKVIHVYESPKVNLTVSRKVVNLGDMVTIDCSLTQGNESYFDLSLSENGKLISWINSPNPSANITITEKQDLYVTCETFIRENNKVLLTSEENITVHYPPVFNDNSCPYSIIWVEGNEITFGCRSEGNPTPEEQCSFGNFSLQTSTSFTAERNMSGVYTCQASNSIGNVIKLVHVTVQYPPEYTTVNILTTSISAGGSVNLTCHSDAMPPPMYKWTIPPQAQVDFSQDNRSITIREASSYHNGNYTCQVKNKHGESSAYQNLEVTSDNTTLFVILGVLGIALLIIALIVLLSYVLRQKGKKGFYDLMRRKPKNIPHSEVPLHANSSV
ncbi:intercellular adhesion molecule 5-like isoform 2-T2 [Mantella aurantiaca]